MIKGCAEEYGGKRLIQSFISHLCHPTAIQQRETQMLREPRETQQRESEREREREDDAACSLHSHPTPICTKSGQIKDANWIYNCLAISDPWLIAPNMYFRWSADNTCPACTSCPAFGLICKSCLKKNKIKVAFLWPLTWSNALRSSRSHREHKRSDVSLSRLSLFFRMSIKRHKEG